jgi:hypothetical protein
MFRLTQRPSSGFTSAGYRRLMFFCTHCIYRVIHKSLRDFRPLRYSRRDGHAEGEHVNRGRDTPSFCPTLQVLHMCTLGDVAYVNPVIKFLRHALQRVSQEFDYRLYVPVFSRPSSGQHFPVEGIIGAHYTVWYPILFSGCA